MATDAHINITVETNVPPISHETIVIAWDSKGDVVFFRSFDFPSQETEMRSAISFVMKNYWPFHIGKVESILHLSKFKEEEKAEES